MLRKSLCQIPNYFVGVLREAFSLHADESSVGGKPYMAPLYFHILLRAVNR
jgi:hypothetical protein